MLALLLAGVFLSVTLAVYLLALAMYEPRKRVEERLSRVFGEEASVPQVPEGALPAAGDHTASFGDEPLDS